MDNRKEGHKIHVYIQKDDETPEQLTERANEILKEGYMPYDVKVTFNLEGHMVISYGTSVVRMSPLKGMRPKPD